MVFTLVAAVNERKTARAVLDETLAELLRLGVLDEDLPSEPETLVPPQIAAVVEKRSKVQELKAQGSRKQKSASS